MPTRINGLTTATNIEADDYLVIDGQTEGTRKVLASEVGGDKMIDFETSLTPSIDARGVTHYVYNVFPVNTADMTLENMRKITAYLGSSQEVYPLITTRVQKQTSYVTINVKSVWANVQGTSSTSISEKLHIVAPFEISRVSASM